MYTKGFKIETKYSKDFKKNMNCAILYRIDGRKLVTPIQLMRSSYNKEIFGTEIDLSVSRDQLDEKQEKQMEWIDSVMSKLQSAKNDYTVCEFCIHDFNNLPRIHMVWPDRINGHVIFRNHENKYNVMFFRINKKNIKKPMLETIKRFDDIVNNFEKEE